MELYNISAKGTDDKDVSLSDYKGKVLLIVNTATGCGFTPQYKGLQELYDKYSEKGFVVLDFPCNQFANQAPGNDAEITSFCTLNYGTTFPRFAKVDVNGAETAPVFKYLKSAKGGLFGSAVKWNFTKFLVSSDGKVVKRYAPTVAPEKIEKDILALLK